VTGTWQKYSIFAFLICLWNSTIINNGIKCYPSSVLVRFWILSFSGRGRGGDVGEDGGRGGEDIVRGDVS